MECLPEKRDIPRVATWSCETSDQPPNSIVKPKTSTRPHVAYICYFRAFNLPPTILSVYSDQVGKMAPKEIIMHLMSIFADPGDSGSSGQANVPSDDSFGTVYGEGILEVNPEPFMSTPQFDESVNEADSIIPSTSED